MKPDRAEKRILSKENRKVRDTELHGWDGQTLGKMTRCRQRVGCGHVGTFWTSSEGSVGAHVLL